MFDRGAKGMMKQNKGDTNEGKDIREERKDGKMEGT